MKITLASKDRCTGCVACVSVCPQGCIKMVEDKEGFLQPKIDQKKCIGCRKCEKICPILNPPIISSDFETQAYAAINKDEDVRMRSSSGGVFHALAKWTIEKGGVVFGACFNERWEVVHDYTETLEGIEPFMRSKYVQSNVGETYKQAKQFLQQGRQVLYTGTPCQIGGLKAYLNKDYDNLMAVDLICHGVPSPRVWREYLKSFEAEQILSINFKDKSDGWLSKQCMVTISTDFKTIKSTQLDNPFFRCFREGIIMRDSCYRCGFRDLRRISDITISDFWGVQIKCPEMFDNKGTSLVFIHSNKALDLFKILPELFVVRQNVKNIAVGDKGLDANPHKSPFRRYVFYKNLSCFSFMQSMKIIDLITQWQSVYVRYKDKTMRKLKKAKVYLISN